VYRATLRGGRRRASEAVVGRGRLLFLLLRPAARKLSPASGEDREEEEGERAGDVKSGDGGGDRVPLFPALALPHFPRRLSPTCVRLNSLSSTFVAGPPLRRRRRRRPPLLRLEYG